ncbi:MAG TPA: hypothetical protein VHV80_11340 [Steroidobacteraceae bacterium]|jgi:hypothetical protein|nr:hypothetical protein [Steroidobacteraceae bacterium]
MSRSVRQRVLAIIAAFAMVTVICGFTAQGFATHASGTDHSDWSMHFTGVSGSAPKPVPIARPVLAARLPPAVASAAPRTPRRPRAHLARGPPTQLHPASSAA